MPKPHERDLTDAVGNGVPSHPGNLIKWGRKTMSDLWYVSNHTTNVMIWSTSALWQDTHGLVGGDWGNYPRGTQSNNKLFWKFKQGGHRGWRSDLQPKLTKSYFNIWLVHSEIWGWSLSHADCCCLEVTSLQGAGRSYSESRWYWEAYACATWLGEDVGSTFET